MPSITTKTTSRNLPYRFTGWDITSEGLLLNKPKYRLVETWSRQQLTTGNCLIPRRRSIVKLRPP